MSRTILPSLASRTTSQTVGFSTIAPHGQPDTIAVVIDLTDLEAGAPSLTVTLRGIDTVSGKTFDILTSTAISTVTTRVLRIGPAFTGNPNLVAKDIVPEEMELFVAHANANPVTYSVGLIHG